MIIVRQGPNLTVMSSRTDSTSSLLIALVLIVTFPLWLGLGMGLFGVLIGLIAGFFGLMIGIIALPFKLLFGWGEWGWGCDVFPHFHHARGLTALVIIIIAVLIVKNRNTSKQ
jgi:hypothetical protein